MQINEIEHIIAPRLEADVKAMYAELRFGANSNPAEHRSDSAIFLHWLNVFLEYAKEWDRLMFSTKSADLSFWSNQFRKAYDSVQNKLNGNPDGLGHVQPNDAKLITKAILDILIPLFHSTGFMEQIHKANNAYEKIKERFKDTYIEATKCSVDAIDLKFYLQISDRFYMSEPITDLSKYLVCFKNRIQMQAWYKSTVLVQYYQIVRDNTRNKYVIRFYLTCHRAFYDPAIDYARFVLMEWQAASRGIGELLELQEQSKIGVPFNPFNFEDDDIFPYEEPMNPLDDLSSLPDALTSMQYKKNQICVSALGVPYFGMRSHVKK